MIDLMMLAISLQRLIAAKTIGVIDRAFPGSLFNMLHQLWRAHPFDDASINVAFSLKKPENKAFSGCSSSTLTFAPTSKVSLVEFDLAAQAPGLKLGCVIETFSQMLIDARDRLLIQLQIGRQTVRWHLLIKAFDDLQLAAKLRKRFLPSAARTLNVTSSRAIDFERTAENTLSATRKVGRTTEMARFDCNHWRLAYASGYFSP